MNHLPLRGLITGLNVQPPFGKFPHVTLVMSMIANILDSHPILNEKYTGFVFQVPSVPLENSSNLCNNFSNSLRCVIIKC